MRRFFHLDNEARSRGYEALIYASGTSCVGYSKHRVCADMKR